MYKPELDPLKFLNLNSSPELDAVPALDRDPIDASEILEAGAQHIKDRAATYDKKGERSIPNTVKAFNAITGHTLTAEQGWLFMAVLKAVRTQQGEFKLDSYEDAAAYFALMCEQANTDR